MTGKVDGNPLNPILSVIDLVLSFHFGNPGLPGRPNSKDIPCKAKLLKLYREYLLFPMEFEPRDCRNRKSRTWSITDKIGFRGLYPLLADIGRAEK